MSLVSTRALAAAAAAVAVAVPLFARPALAETYRDEIVFDQEHECTLENVVGDTKVKITIETKNNPDGTTTVKSTQHTHGSQLRGVISGDKYVFNNSEDVVETFTLLGSSGSVKSKTIFVHNGESVANLETPGLDDFHQHFSMTFSPLLPPVILKDRAECQ
ncbi:MAG TPA: hypothetical protein VHN37_14835 [Actinomycetota bacterium]|nr:hypothetical protein [Actinomycetota bacterium]